MASFLGEVHFEEVEGGRVRCIETGHEMPLASKEGYGHSKKCRRTLFDLSLAQKKPPLNVFEQSPTSKDKVVCKLTGDLLNKSEDALWKHMNGKKFQRKLAQKEAEKKPALQKAVGDAMDVCEDQETSNHFLPMQEDEDGNVVCEEPEFWVPPVEDLDNGCCDDVPSLCADQMCESQEGNNAHVAFTGIKRKAKKVQLHAHQKKKRRPDGIY